MSTVFEAFQGPQQQPPASFPRQNTNTNLLTQIRQFANMLNSDPEQTVRNMLQMGKMTQQQFNYFGQQASQIQAMLGLR